MAFSAARIGSKGKVLPRLRYGLVSIEFACDRIIGIGSLAETFCSHCCDVNGVFGRWQGETDEAGGMMMLQHAFKEWAVICEALAQGQQAIILRKGGIAEHDDEFRVEQTRFWLYPTYVHQQKDGISEEARPLLLQAQANQPPAGKLRLRTLGRGHRDLSNS